MKRKAFSILFALVLVLSLGLVMAAPAAAATPTTFSYADVALSGGFQSGHFLQVWDLTACDLIISFTYDASGLVDDFGGDAHTWAELGVREAGYGDFNPTWMTEGAGVWLATDYEWTENTFDPDPVGSPTLDLDDKLILQKGGGLGEGSYDLPSTPPNPWANHAVWFDRDGVDQWQAQMWGAIDGVTYNTSGTYDVVITLHAQNATSGTAYMTVNSEPQGFYVPNWHSGAADLMPAGMTFTGDMAGMQVFYGLYGYGATHSIDFNDITVTGCLAAGMVTGGGWIDSPPGAYHGPFCYGDQTLSDWQSGNFAEVFDLTQGDLILSYTLDMSGIETAGWAVTEVGLRERGAANIDPNLQGGWMQSNYISETSNPNSQNINDIHLLSKHGWLYQKYDAKDADTLVTPYWSNANYGFWFDRDGVDTWQANLWGMVDGGTYNTDGLYEIVINYHAIDDDTGTMFATINGVKQGLYVGGWKDAEPEFYPAGRSFTGDMTQMQVFYGRGGGGGSVTVSNIEVMGPAVLTGKATFGFVSRYKKGASTPTGQTEFVFRAADLNFHSSSYDWLVVTGSDYAKFKGSGTINGIGDYKFMLWAGDGEPDTFRIKIWEEDESGDETVIYDNGMNQPIAGGQIVVHKK